jgi:hypothetical protein
VVSVVEAEDHVNNWERDLNKVRSFVGFCSDCGNGT